MSNIDSTLQLSNKALENFDFMKKSILGIHEVLKLVLNEKDILYKIGMDNLLGMYDNFLQLMMNEYGAIAFMRKLRTSKIDLEIPLDDTPLKKEF